MATSRGRSQPTSDSGRTTDRQRIIDATIALHSRSVLGISTAEIAAEAGVAESAVTRAFPDEVDLLTACTAEYDRLHPPPDLEPLTTIDDAAVRLRAALTGLYHYYAENEAMQANGRLALALRPQLYPAFARYVEFGMRVHQVLTSAFGHAPADGSATAAAIGHALDFATWRDLHHQQGLTSDQAVSLMVSLVLAAASGEAP